MPFQLGKPKTGGRVKGSVNTARRSTRFAERLKGYGFNYDAELAQVLKDLKALRNAERGTSDAIRRIEELKFYYAELKSLLPYMSPKLKEKEVIANDDSEDPATSPQEPISDEAILKVLGNGKEPNDNPRAGIKDLLAARDSQLQTPAGPEDNLHDLASEQEADE